MRFSSGGQLSVEVEVVELDKVESRPGEMSGYARRERSSWQFKRATAAILVAEDSKGSGLDCSTDVYRGLSTSTLFRLVVWVV